MGPVHGPDRAEMHTLCFVLICLSVDATQQVIILEVLAWWMSGYA
jgi:hypothetical protein